MFKSDVICSTYYLFLGAYISSDIPYALNSNLWPSTSSMLFASVTRTHSCEFFLYNIIAIKMHDGLLKVSVLSSFLPWCRYRFSIFHSVSLQSACFFNVCTLWCTVPKCHANADIWQKSFHAIASSVACRPWKLQATHCKFLLPLEFCKAYF